MFGVCMSVFRFTVCPLSNCSVCPLGTIVHVFMSVVCLYACLLGVCMSICNVHVCQSVVCQCVGCLDVCMFVIPIGSYMFMSVSYLLNLLF